jgi:hypothetical protein
MLSRLLDKWVQALGEVWVENKSWESSVPKWGLKLENE